MFQPLSGRDEQDHSRSSSVENGHLQDGQGQDNGQGEGQGQMETDPHEGEGQGQNADQNSDESA